MCPGFYTNLSKNFLPYKNTDTKMASGLHKSLPYKIVTVSNLPAVPADTAILKGGHFVLKTGHERIKKWTYRIEKQTGASKNLFKIK